MRTLDDAIEAVKKCADNRRLTIDDQHVSNNALKDIRIEVITSEEACKRCQVVCDSMKGFECSVKTEKMKKEGVKQNA